MKNCCKGFFEEKLRVSTNNYQVMFACLIICSSVSRSLFRLTNPVCEGLSLTCSVSNWTNWEIFVRYSVTHRHSSLIGCVASWYLFINVFCLQYISLSLSFVFVHSYLFNFVRSLLMRKKFKILATFNLLKFGLPSYFKYDK